MRLVTVRVIGALGLTLDVWFHWLEERNFWEFLVDDFFEAENEARWDQFLLGGDAFIRGLSVTAHVLLLTALLALILAPYAIRELRGSGLPLRFWRWWGGVGLAVDFVFHWLEQGSVADFLLDDFFEGSVFFRLLSLLAHIAFITATLLLILAPQVIDELRKERVIVMNQRLCADGWMSPSAGSGRCSHHGGVMSYADQLERANRRP